MASNPTKKLEVFAYNKNASPGFLYDKSNRIDRFSSGATNTEKQSQGIELPDTHNSQRKIEAKDHDKTYSQHSVGVLKKSEQNVNYPSYLPETQTTLSETSVSMSGKYKSYDFQFSNRKSYPSKAYDASHKPVSARCRQSNQSQTKKSDNIELHGLPPGNKKDELKLKQFGPQNRPLEGENQVNKNLLQPLLLTASEAHHSSCNKDDFKSEQMTTKNQPVSEKSIADATDPFEFKQSGAESCLTLMEPVNESEVCGIAMKYYGVFPKAEGKTIIFLGASGSGKTSLVNFIANFFKGNKTAAADKLIQVVRTSNDTYGHTTQITGYTFCANEYDNPLTVIDTPGLNDSSGVEIQDRVQSLKAFLANAESQNLNIHAIGFVAQAHIVRLTSSERLVMDYISSLFGEGIGKHVITLITFSDSQKAPPVVEAITGYGVPCSAFLIFNNSVLSCNEEEEIDELDRIYWRIGRKSWKTCIKQMENLPSLSLSSLKDEIYTAQIMKKAERDLKIEIEGFLNDGRNKIITKKMLNNAERVWTLAETIKKLQSIKTSQCTTENILISFVEEICTTKNVCLTTKECMKLLSLSPSRPLWKTGVAILASFAPLYNSAKSASCIPKQKIPDVLFCHQCEEDHILEYLCEKSGLFSIFDKKHITYRCTQCWCDGGVHGKISTEMKDDIMVSNGFTRSKLRHHIRNCIENILNALCMPEYRISEDEFIRYLSYLANKETQVLCKDLFTTRN